MLCDYHVHTDTSYDCDMPLSESLPAFASLGIGEICVTDHCEFPRCPNTEEPMADFAAQHAFLRGRDWPISVKCGMEVSMYDDALSAQEIAEALAPLQPDFVLGSVHEYEGGDPYMQSFYEGRTRQETLLDYLGEVHRCVQRHDFFDCVSHIDYPQKFMPYEDKLLHYSDAADLMDDLFKILISRGQGFELNVSAYRALPAPQMDIRWLARYRELGGEVLTFGSDCHRVEYAGRWIAQAHEFAMAAGFTHFTRFENRKPVFEKLGR